MRTFFGGAIAVVLLLVYAYAVWVAISIVLCVSQPSCEGLTRESFTDGMVTAVSLIGGLVSALVIAILAVTEPGKVPGARILDQDVSASRPAKIVTSLYLGVWILTGLAAFIVGYMQHPKVLQPLTDLGQSWLGLAVAAAYAYLGIRPSGTT